MWFLATRRMESVPKFFAYFSKLKDCQCIFKKHYRQEQVQFPDVYRCLFFCQHFVVGCPDHRRIFRYPHGLEFGFVEVFLADHVHACSRIHHKLSFNGVYCGCGRHNPLFGRRIECGFLLFFELANSFGKIPCLASGASLLSFSLCLRCEICPQIS